MEILAETTFWGEFIFYLTIAGFGAAVCIALSALFIIEVTRNKDGVLLPAIISSVIAILFILCLVVGTKQGPNVEYTAKVTDYNEVYEQGFEVIRHEGKLVILTKESR